MKKHGFYIIKDCFFTEMDEPYLKGNKSASRPHYYCFKETEGIYWMIPLSSRIEKYKSIIARQEAKGYKCNTLHIVKLDNNKESVFLIQDMFPITEKYIERAYTIANNPLLLTSEKTIAIIDKKARKVIKLLKHGVKFMPTQPDVLRILEKLKAELSGNQNPA